ncbi:hypothetical protein [Aeromicrobium sp. 179-A 4D2 NHS]|uniref:hypothetical protein n=1 Tax=Aeromicrobium sp. 179-A 4D2 NHS TaxID=3142375 RepID=UPI0039A218EB
MKDIPVEPTDNMVTAAMTAFAGTLGIQYPPVGSPVDVAIRNAVRAALAEGAGLAQPKRERPRPPRRARAGFERVIPREERVSSYEQGAADERRRHEFDEHMRRGWEQDNGRDDRFSLT